MPWLTSEALLVARLVTKDPLVTEKSLLEAYLSLLLEGHWCRSEGNCQVAQLSVALSSQVQSDQQK